MSLAVLGVLPLTKSSLSPEVAPTPLNTSDPQPKQMTKSRLGGQHNSCHIVLSSDS